MITIKMFCNTRVDTQTTAAGAKCEVETIQNNKIFVKMKDKSGIEISLWIPKNDLTNFRYMAWYNGVKAEFVAAKKLAKMGTILFNSSGQDLIKGSFEIQEIKKLINQIHPLSEYFANKK